MKCGFLAVPISLNQVTDDSNKPIQRMLRIIVGHIKKAVQQSGRLFMFGYRNNVRSRSRWLKACMGTLAQLFCQALHLASQALRRERIYTLKISSYGVVSSRLAITDREGVASL